VDGDKQDGKALGVFRRKILALMQAPASTLAGLIAIPGTQLSGMLRARDSAKVSASVGEQR
jgi:hypothetical protein